MKRRRAPVDRTSFRAVLCFLLLGLAVPILAVRLVYLQVGRAPENRENVARQRLRAESLPAPEGTIVDRAGRLLAYDRPVLDVRAEAYLTSAEAESPESVDRFANALATDLAFALSADAASGDSARLQDERRARLRERILAAAQRTDPRSPTSRHIDFLVGTAIDSATVLEHLRTADARRDYLHLHYIASYARTFPDRDATIGPVGFAGWRDTQSGKPVPLRRGMEAFEGLRAGRDGARISWQDALAQRYWTADGSLPERPPVLETTLDLELQKAATEELQRAVRAVEEHYSSPPEWGALCVADIETGEVLAMASYREGVDPRAGTFAPLQCLCPPGSVVKPLLFAIALERGVLNWHGDTFDCTPNAGKSWLVPHSSRKITDEHPAGRLTPRQILVQSSNVGAVQVGLLLGREGLDEFLHRYRFGTVTGTRIPGEATGDVVPFRRGGLRAMSERAFWVYSAPSLSIGYEYSITPMQLLRAYVSLLSGCERELTLYRRYARNGEVTVFPAAERGARVVSPANLELLREAMCGVVSEEANATGRPLFEELRRNGLPPVGGKTGTSEYEEARNGEKVWIRTASFAGFVPVDKPRFVAVCVLQKPKASAFWGGRYAAPATGRLLLRALSQPSLRRTEYPQVSAGGAEGGARLEQR
jgi:cell division protein FtsI/penicillin-binding protein 2